MIVSLVFLLEQISIGLYFIIGFFVLRYLWLFAAERGEYRSTYFELERDLSRQRQAGALTTVIILIEIAVILLGVQQVVAPVLRQEVELDDLVRGARAQDGLFVTPTPPPLSGNVDIDPVGPLSQEDIIPGVQPTPTLTPTPVGTIIPNAPRISGCDSDAARLQIPTNGMRVFNTVEVIGSASVPDFAFAKIELKGPGTFDNYIVIDDKRNPIVELSPFSQFVPSPFTEGWYEFRLAVFDITQTMRAHCMVNIYITAPFPTLTPIGQ